MNFTTKVTIPTSPFRINYEDKIMLVGSCFSEHVGDKLSAAYFQSIQNPFGILYNPISIANCLDFIINNKPFAIENLVNNDDLWHSMYHHGDFSDTTVEKCLEKINTSLNKAHSYLSDCSVMLLTFGTAWVYEQDGEVVGNCHKQPAASFTRRRLTVDEIVCTYSHLISQLITHNSQLKVIFTVSPVRHWKDGAHENQLSKSILLLAIDELCDLYPEQCSYFPSYEIIMDELRDYRYYAEDMLHPNATAVNYVWERFSEMYFDTHTMSQKKELEQLYCDLQHRPIHADTDAYRKFEARTQAKLKRLQEIYPWIE